MKNVTARQRVQWLLTMRGWGEMLEMRGVSREAIEALADDIVLTIEEAEALLRTDYEAVAEQLRTAALAERRAA